MPNGTLGPGPGAGHLTAVDDRGIGGLAGILPPYVSVASRQSSAGLLPLEPSDRAALGSVSPRYEERFAGGRDCARRALAGLGVREAPVGRGRAGKPLWPEGTVGSITHTRSYIAAAVARVEMVRAIGIDAEAHRQLDDSVVRRVCVASELDWVDRLAPRNGTVWPLVLFSAKESIYKAWYPLAGTWIGFADAEVTVDVARMSLVARLRPRLARQMGLETVCGRFAVDATHVFTTIVVPR